MPISPSQFLFQSGGGVNAFTQLSGNPLFSQLSATYSVGNPGHVQFGISGTVIQWANGTASVAGTFVSWPRSFANIHAAVASPSNQIVAINVNPGVNGCTLTCSSGTPAVMVIGIGT